MYVYMYLCIMHVQEFTEQDTVKYLAGELIWRYKNLYREGVHGAGFSKVFGWRTNRGATKICTEMELNCMRLCYVHCFGSGLCGLTLEVVFWRSVPFYSSRKVNEAMHSCP